MKKTILYLLLISILLTFGCSKEGKKEVPSATQESSSEGSNKPSTNATNQDQTTGNAGSWIDTVKGSHDSHYDAARPIVEVSDCFYYITANGINKIDKEFKQYEEVLLNPDITNLYYYDEQLYYSDEKNIFCLSESKPIWNIDNIIHKNYPGVAVGGVADFHFREGFLYVQVSGDSIFQIDLSTGEEEVFLADCMAYAFLGDACFFIDAVNKTFSIYKKNLKTDEITLVRGNGEAKRYNNEEDILRIDDLLVFDNHLYYTTRSPQPALYRYNSNGDELIQEFDTSFGIIRDPKEERIFISIWHPDRTTIYLYANGKLQEMARDTRGLDAFVTDSCIFYKTDISIAGSTPFRYVHIPPDNQGTVSVKTAP